jgi:hypothetical protein
MNEHKSRVQIGMNNEKTSSNIEDKVSCLGRFLTSMNVHSRNIQCTR